MFAMKWKNPGWIRRNKPNVIRWCEKRWASKVKEIARNKIVLDFVKGRYRLLVSAVYLDFIAHEDHSWNTYGSSYEAITSMQTDPAIYMTGHSFAGDLRHQIVPTCWGFIFSKWNCFESSCRVFQSENLDSWFMIYFCLKNCVFRCWSSWSPVFHGSLPTKSIVRLFRIFRWIILLVPKMFLVRIGNDHEVIRKVAVENDVGTLDDD